MIEFRGEKHLSQKKDPFSAAFFVLLYFKYMNKNQYLTA